jgi:hypothetical protein
VHTLRRALVILLAWASLGGCMGTGLRENGVPAESARLIGYESPKKAVFIGRGPAGQRLVCLFRPSRLAAVHEDIPHRPSDLQTADAELLTQGLYDLCTQYRDGNISGEQYAAALEDYAPLVVSLAGYRALGGEVPTASAAPQLRYVSTLIDANRAMLALCASPGFRSRLAKHENLSASTGIAVWCNQAYTVK